MDRLDLTAQLGARAFVDREGLVHLRNRFSGEVFCGATEATDTAADGEPGEHALADGPEPEEAGLGDTPVEEWPWHEECRILGRGAGIIVYVPEELPAPDVQAKAVEP